MSSAVLIAPRNHHFSFHNTHPIRRKEVDFGGGKVLLSKLGDKVYATSAFCTHYGAPLAKGVLVADGRLVRYFDSVVLSTRTFH